jgi:hypothetical protein
MLAPNDACQFAPKHRPIVLLIGPKFAEFAVKVEFYGGFCGAKLMLRLTGKPEFDENKASKSKSRSIPAARQGGDDVD